VDWNILRLTVRRVHLLGATWPRRSIARGLVLGLVISAQVIAGSATGVVAAQGNQGLQDGWAIDDDGKVSGGLHLLVDGQFDYMVAAGAGWARINFRLGNCFSDWTTPVAQSAVDSGVCEASTLGRTATDQYVQVVQASRRRGLRVLGLLSNETVRGDQSDWTAFNVEHNPRADGTNDYIQRFAATAGVLASRFSDGNQRVDEWEIWNEPNAWSDNPSPGVYTGSSFVYPSNFAQLLQRSYDAVKRVSPGSQVVSGGLFGHDQGGATTVTAQSNGTMQRIVRRGIVPQTAPAASNAAAQARASSTCTSMVPSGADYLCQTYQMGIAKARWNRSSGPFDQIGQHLYVDQGGPTSAGKISRYLQDVRQTYLAFEGRTTGKRTEITEFGWNTYNLSPLETAEAVQADNLRIAYVNFRGTSYVRRAFWFRTQDLPWDGHGLMGFEWDGPAQPKPAMMAYQQTAVF
jgi:hypothetical protein